MNPEKKLSHFNKLASSRKYKSNQILQALAIQPGTAIADVGSGGGFYTTAFARAGGKVTAVDTNEENLAYVFNSAGEMGFENVETFVTPVERLELPAHEFDLIFMRNMFHHLPDPNTYCQNIAHFLKPEGRVAIIDYKKVSGFSLSFASLHQHYSDPAKIREVMNNAGLVLIKTYDFLPNQSFQVFAIKP